MTRRELTFLLAAIVMGTIALAIALRPPQTAETILAVSDTPEPLPAVVEAPEPVLVPVETIRYITVTIAAEGEMNTAANMREGPGTRFPTIAVIPAGAMVQMHECPENWCYVSYQGTTIGWVWGEFVDFRTER